MSISQKTLVETIVSPNELLRHLTTAAIYHQ